MNYAQTGYVSGSDNGERHPEVPKPKGFPDLAKLQFPQMYKGEMLKPEDLNRPPKAKTAAHGYV